MSTFAAEILLYAGIHPSIQLNKLSQIEHEHIYNSMKDVLKSAAEKGGRITERDLYNMKGTYLAMTERKHIGEHCPVCDHILEKNSSGGVTAFCPNCQKR